MKTKTASIEQYIISRINSGEFPPDSRIPSQFKLMQQFNCSRIIVQRALKHLSDAGFLQSSRGSGTFVRRGPYGNTLKELVIVSEFAENSPVYSFSGFLFNLNIPDIPIRWVNKQFLSRTSERFFVPGQAVIWVLPAESQIMLMDQLCQRGIPQLLINRDYGNFNSICTDHRASIAEGLPQLLRDGEKEVAVITPSPSTKIPYMADRLLAFYEECFRIGATIPPGWLIKQDSDDIKELNSKVEKLFSSKHFPRKIFLPHERFLTGFILCATRLNLTLGKDYEVLVFAQKQLMPPDAGLFMLHQPMEEFRDGVEEFVKRTAAGSRGPFQLRLKAVLVNGE